MRTPLLFVPALLWPMLVEAATATADKEATYEIEVLVIENRLPDLVGDELLAREPESLRVRGLETAVPPETAAVGEPYLQAVVAPQLERDGSYRILARAHWQQTVDPNPKQSSKPVRISSLSPSNPNELEGAVRFSMSRYLHLDVNLLFRPPASDGVEQVYRISEQRRVKSQETQYFDHPRFGVLVRVMPAEKPEKEKRP